MKIEASIAEIRKLERAVSSLATRFTVKRIWQPQEPLRTWYSDWPRKLFEVPDVTAVHAMSPYGVYLLATSRDKEVVYVGRATPHVRRAKENAGNSRYNLAAEIWSKIEKPIVSGRGVRFPGHRRAIVLKARLDPTVRAALKAGDVLVVAVEIEPWVASALVEAHLHATAFIADGRLPAANDRIC